MTPNEAGRRLLRDGGTVDADTGEPAGTDAKVKETGAALLSAALALELLSIETGFPLERIITTMIEGGIMDDERVMDPKYFTSEKWDIKRGIE